MDRVSKFLKKVGIYAAIGFIFGAIIALFILRIIRGGTDRRGITDIDRSINGIQSGITEATELNEDAQELAANAKSKIDDSTKLNQQIGDEITNSESSIDRLTAAGEQLAELVVRLQERARAEG